jgi:hypothetical protein
MAPSEATTQNGRQGHLDSDPQLPPWANVDPAEVVRQLTSQLAGMIQQLAMRDAYIAQLHEAMVTAMAAVPGENAGQPA